MDLTEEEVQKILRLVDELDYGEIHLEIGALKVDLVKAPASGGAVRDAAATRASPSVSRSAGATAQHDATTRRASGSAADSTPLPPGAHIVVAPVAGTFYRAPSPGAAPFVEIGAQVAAGDPVGLLEVMKLFNSIPADISGCVVRVLVADATAVTEGQALVAIDPQARA
jgi:acetyl-CoA carboxylase biotin carboxyl carrier protein